MAKEFDRRLATPFDPAAGEARLQAEARALDQIRAAAIPPGEMSEAASAPARGFMRLVPEYELSPGGTRRRVSAHWAAACMLTVMNTVARRRHADRQRDGDAVVPFSAAHIETAGKYRALVEWREGSCIKGQSFDSTRAGGGDGFLDRYIDKGDALARVWDAIGHDVALSPRRHMDRGNARKVISVRAVVDKAVLVGIPLGAILTSYGWQDNGQNRKAIRLVLCQALDRMRDHL
jgi:hypothetical protein